MSLSGAMVDEELDGLDAAVEEAREAGSVYLVLELSHVPFIDSAGLQKLLRVTAEFGRSNGSLCVAGLNDTCQDIFRATRLRSLIQVHPDIDSALGSLL